MPDTFDRRLSSSVNKRQFNLAAKLNICDTLNSSALNCSGDNYNQDAYDYSYEYEEDNH